MAQDPSFIIRRTEGVHTVDGQGRENGCQLAYSTYVSRVDILSYDAFIDLLNKGPHQPLENHHQLPSPIEKYVIWARRPDGLMETIGLTI